jgi:hypothetical protein
VALLEPDPLTLGELVRVGLCEPLVEDIADGASARRDAMLRPR